MELSLLLLWAVGECIGPAGAAAEAARGGLGHTDTQGIGSPLWEEGEGGGSLGISRGAELTAAQALLEAVELVLYESQSRG